MTNYEKIKNMSIEDVAKSRIQIHTAINGGGYTYFCGDFNEKGNHYKKCNRDCVHGIILNTKSNRYGIFDLCDDCVNELMKFLNNER